jgi:hypothetical protein
MQQFRWSMGLEQKGICVRVTKAASPSKHTLMLCDKTPQILLEKTNFSLQVKINRMMDVQNCTFILRLLKGM